MDGHCDARFARVGEEFERNFAKRGELGASLCVMVEGEPVVDLWGGSADADGRAWEKDTVSVMWSATKGATALCAHVLAHRGQLDWDSPVARYWPEFGRSGKDAVTVAEVLAHRSGVSAPSAPVPAGGFYDERAMVDALAAQAPLFPPDTRHGYHANTFGWLVGEIVRRVSGRSVGTFLREEIAGPLGADVQIGATPSTRGRTASMLLPEPDPAAPQGPLVAAMADPSSATALMIGNDGGYVAPGPQGFDSQRAHATELPATGGLGNGRGLATLYAPLALGGAHRGVRLVGAEDLARMATTVSAGLDDTLRIPTRFSLGYMRSTDNRRRPPGAQDSMILGPEAFGHPGYGGTLGFADPHRRVSFGYTMTRMGPGILLDDRGQALVDALYRTMGATSSAAGVWV